MCKEPSRRKVSHAISASIPRQLQFQEDGSVSTWTYNSMVARESLGRLITTTDLPINFSDNSFYEDHVRSYIIINLKKLVEQPLKVICCLL